MYLKVLFLSDYLFPSPNGIAVYCENTIRCLKKMGCEVITFGPKGCPSADYTLPTVHIHQGTTATFCFPNWKLLKTVLFSPFDVIHINCPQVVSGFLLCLIAKWRKIKVVYYNHGNVAIYCKYNYKRKWYRKIATRASGTIYYLPQLLFNPIILQNPGSSDLHSLFKKQSKTRLSFYGTNEVAQWLQRAQACITASLFETWGLTLSEALACGTPIIYPNHSPFPQLYGQSFPKGLYEIEDANSFVQAVRQTEQSSVQLREKCRAFASQYTWENATKMLIEAYR